MNYEPVGLDRFYGGMSTDTNIGSDAQFYYSRNVDFRKNPSKLSVLPGGSNIGSTVVTDLLLGMDQINTGVRYAVGDSGRVYSLSSGTFTYLDSIGETSGAGILYRSDVDHIYVTGQTKIARIPRVTSGGTLNDAWFENGVSASSTCTKTGGANTYTTTTSISETATHKRSFTADIEPIYKIGVKVVSKGTGNWTLTLHDDANNSLGAVTIVNASLTNGAINYFTFSSPIRVQRGDNGAGSALTYHFHVTSTVADGTVQSTTASSLADCDMELWANALVETNNTLHPIIQFSNYVLIGNGRYVAAYEPLQDSPTTSDFNRHRLTLPPGYEVCGFAQKNTMCIIGAEKRSSSGEFQDGYLFFWDGVAQTFNDFWPVPEGSPGSLFSHKNVVYFIAGGALYRMRGSDEPIKKRTFRNTDSEYSGVSDVTHVNPNMMTVRRGVLLMGYPSTTTNISLEHVIRSYGAISSEYPESYGINYTLSTGSINKNGTNNLTIGMIKSYGDTLYISWRDDDNDPTYGVDMIDNSSDPSPTAQIETLDFDDGRPYAFKKAGDLLCTFDDLPDGVTITLKYKIDDGSWQYGTAVSSGVSAKLNVNQRYRTIRFGVDITCTSTSPYITSLYLFGDMLRKERIMD